MKHTSFTLFIAILPAFSIAQHRSEWANLKATEKIIKLLSDDPNRKAMLTPGVNKAADFMANMQIMESKSIVGYEHYTIEKIHQKEINSSVTSKSMNLFFMSDNIALASNTAAPSSKRFNYPYLHTDAWDKKNSKKINELISTMTQTALSIISQKYP